MVVVVVQACREQHVTVLTSLQQKLTGGVALYKQEQARQPHMALMFIFLFTITCIAFGIDDVVFTAGL